MPERHYLRRVLEIIKSNELFSSEREVKMLVRVNTTPFTTASLLKEGKRNI